MRNIALNKRNSLENNYVTIVSLPSHLFFPFVWLSDF